MRENKKPLENALNLQKMAIIRGFFKPEKGIEPSTYALRM
jgi:hypothetical protein